MNPIPLTSEALMGLIARRGVLTLALGTALAVPSTARAGAGSRNPEEGCPLWPRRGRSCPDPAGRLR